MSDDRIRDLLRQGWRAEDWSGKMTAVDSDGYLLVSRTEDCVPYLRDPATFCLVLAVLAHRVGLPDTAPVPYAWWRVERPASIFEPDPPFWNLACVGTGLRHAFTGAIGAEPDPVVALAAALAQTLEVR